MRVARTKRWKWKISSFDIQRNFHMTPGMWDGECEQEKRGREQQTFLKSDLQPNLTMTHSCLCRQCNKSSGARIGILNTTKYLNELIPGYQSGSPLKTSKQPMIEWLNGCRFGSSVRAFFSHSSSAFFSSSIRLGEFVSISLCVFLCRSGQIRQIVVHFFSLHPSLPIRTTLEYVFAVWYQPLTPTQKRRRYSAHCIKWGPTSSRQ